MSEAAGKLYTLTEVSKETKISMPTLQRYKKLHQERIPSVGEGRSQRYPAKALPIFLELKKENIGKRGRPRKKVAEAKKKEAEAAKAPARRGRPKKAAAAPAAKSDKLLTLTSIAQKTGISYPTLLRYVKTHIKDIPHKGTGRARRYFAEAVEVFQRLRAESGRGRRPKAAGEAPKRRGRPPKAGAKRRGRPPKAASGEAPKRRGRPPRAASEVAMAERIKELEKGQKQLLKAIGRLEKQIAKPIRLVGQR